MRGASVHERIQGLFPDKVFTPVTSEEEIQSSADTIALISWPYTEHQFRNQASSLLRTTIYPLIATARPYWREDRPEMIRLIAGYGWSSDTVNERAALVAAELRVMAIEAVAALWHPEDCRIAAVRIDGKPVVSLVCSVE